METLVDLMPVDMKMVNHRPRRLMNNMPRHVCYDILTNNKCWLQAIAIRCHGAIDIDHKVFVDGCYELTCPLATDKDEDIYDEKTRSDIGRFDVVTRTGRQ
jgi:hypothetical protein